MVAFEIWHVWMIACLFFFILEIFIPSFIMASIGIGCLLAFGGALISSAFPLQIVLFSGGTFAGFIGVRPMMHRFMYNKSSIRTNYDGLVGRFGKVIEKIDPDKDSGCVAIDGDRWKAISENDVLIEVGTKVRVVQLDSIVVTVVPLLMEKLAKAEIENPAPDVESGSSLIVGMGTKKHQLDFDDIICFYSNSKTTFLITKNQKEFIHDESLEKLGLMVPRKRFFRVNRQFIISREIISAFKAESNGKIQLEIKPCNSLPASVTVSRLKAHAFRSWMKNNG